MHAADRLFRENNGEELFCICALKCAEILLDVQPNSILVN